jgi:hypothetical protein
VIISGFVWLITDFPNGVFVLGCIMWVYGLMSFTTYLKTGNPYIWAGVLYLFALGFLMMMISDFLSLYSLTDIKDLKTNFPPNIKGLVFIVIVLWILLFFVAMNKKLKWRGREIFELIAQKAEVSDSSYTDRPRYIENVDYIFNDIIGFSKYLKKNFIAMTYREDKTFYICPIKMGSEYSPMYNPNHDYKSKTWVKINQFGEVSVHISKDDYLDYKEDLSFETLSKSLGELFIEFYELYQKREEVRIIDKLNTVKMFPLM